MAPNNPKQGIQFKDLRSAFEDTSTKNYTNVEAWTTISSHVASYDSCKSSQHREKTWSPCNAVTMCLSHGLLDSYCFASLFSNVANSGCTWTSLIWQRGFFNEPWDSEIQSLLRDRVQRAECWTHVHKPAERWTAIYPVYKWHEFRLTSLLAFSWQIHHIFRPLFPTVL